MSANSKLPTPRKAELLPRRHVLSASVTHEHECLWIRLDLADGQCHSFTPRTFSEFVWSPAHDARVASVDLWPPEGFPYRADYLVMRALTEDWREAHEREREAVIRDVGAIVAHDSGDEERTAPV